MAIQLINVGETANDTTGDSLRTAFLKCNANFTELYNVTATGMRPWVFTETDYIAFNGDRILVDTSTGEVTITLPSDPVQGDWVQIADAWNFSVNNLVIQSLRTVEGFAEDIRIDIRGLFIEFIFGETTWKILTSLGVQGPPGPPGEVEEGRAYNISVTGDDSTVLVDGMTNTINLDGTIRGDVVPDQDSQYDLGSLNLQWKSLYVSNNTVYLGGRPLSLVGDTLAIGSEDGSTVSYAATQDYVDAAIGDGIPQTLTDLGITDGTAGQVLTTNGQGTYTFQTPADVSVVPYAVFTDRVDPIGTPYEFTKPSGTDLEDPIDTDLTLTRKWGAGGAIYNSALEVDYEPSVSPQGTLWNAEGWGNLDDVKTRYYTTFRQVFRNKVGLNIIGKELVMHDTINDKYYKIKFTQWDVGAGVGGGFQYTRQLLNTNVPIGLTFADGTIQTTAPKDFWDEPQVYVGDANTYTLDINDRGHHVYAFNSAIQIPSNLQVAFPIGTTVRIIASSSPVRIIPCACITPSVIYRNGFTNPSNEWIISAYSSSTITKIDVNTWRLTSDDGLAQSGNTGDVTFNGVKIIGAGTASGDGAGYSTLELVPDNDLYNNNQYLVIDPTYPTHIHIRAGGTQDASTAELYLGAENNHVRVRDGLGVKLQNDLFTTNFYNFQQGVDYDTATWNTDESGNTWLDIYITDPMNPTRPSGPFDVPFYSFTQFPQNRIEVFDGTNYTDLIGNGQAYTLGNQYQLRIGITQAPATNPTAISSLTFRVDTLTQSALSLENNTFDLSVNQDAYIYADQTIQLTTGVGNFKITTDDNNSSYSWYFTAQGYLQFPQGLGPTTSKGKDGDEAGSVVVDGDYIYYCHTDYSDGVADIWKRIQWGNDTW